ncbi:MAG: lipopolysaccharide biosynthesis protein [Burkholderiales bacterium]
MPSNDSLHRKVMSGLFWSVTQSWGGKLIALALFMVLARVLDPHEFGVFAAAMAVLAFLNIFVDQGLGEAIVQRPQVTPQLLNTVFLLNLVIAVIIVGIVWVASPLIAARMGIEELTDILRVASVILPVSALSFSQQAMQRRNFHYRWLAACTLASILISGALGIWLALHGYGAWSLVVQATSAAMVTTVLLWLKPQWSISFETDFQGAKPLLVYGFNRLGMNLLDFANTRYVELFLAVALGPAALGIYLVGVRVYQALMQALSSAILDVAHNGFSRLAHDKARVRAAYYKAMTVTAAIAVPAFIFLAMLAPEATLLFFGNQWRASADVMQPMALLGAIQVLQFYNGTACNALGKPSISFYFMIFKTMVTFLTLWLVRDQSLLTIVYWYVGSQIATTPVSFYLIYRVLGVSVAVIIKRIWPYLLACLAAAAMMEGIRLLGIASEWLSASRLLLLASVGVTVYVAFVVLIARREVGDLLSSLRRQSD